MYNPPNLGLATRLNGWVLLGLLLAGSLAVESLSAAEPVDFERDVLPIFAAHCLDCHGADFAESDLRLDTPAAVLSGGGSGEPAVVPGDPEASYLLGRVLHDDPSQRMPPDAERLSDPQIDVLRRWIADAEAWQNVTATTDSAAGDHWSFQPLAEPPVPDNGEQHPIDAFIADRLASEGLEFSAPADRRRLVRRLHLIMQGVPPRTERADTFVEDLDPAAWTNLVDEVLAGQRYGERWATYWLDLIRFGETHGFETNRERPHAWRFRDWVIDAFNDDLPYDRFILAQLAGDAVGDPLGTGFLVAGPHDLVKGQDELLQKVQRQDELADLLNTVGTSFMGLTLGCARCHNHKFDPITQTDFYSMQAVFAGVQHGDRPLPPSREVAAERAEIASRIAALEEKLAPYKAGPLRAWVGGQNAQPPRQRQPVRAVGNEEWIEPTPAQYVRFTILGTNGGEPCIDELEIWAGTRNLALASEGARATSNGDFEHPLHQLAHINDGRYGNPRSWISALSTGGWVQIELPTLETIDRISWARDREGKYEDRTATSYRIEVSVDGEAWQTVASSRDRRPPGSEPTAGDRYDFAHLGVNDRQIAEDWVAQLEQLHERHESLSAPRQAYVGTFSQPGPTHRLYRGEPSAPRETVVPAAIAALGSVRLDEDAPERRRRLEIARWIASPENPLTARVMVNRIWQHHFGNGLVSTPNDFGRNGVPPTHPRLLDWLAAEFIRSGWSVKHIQRLILTSKTWRQDSTPRADGLRVDAGDRLLWRFPPRRMSAEAIRDSMLLVSGKLDDRVGGPGFSPFEVELENVRHYHPKQEYGPEDWRRMIYMTRVRQEREATFGLFDCPDFSQGVPQRSRSTTPLQALNLFNSPFVLEQAGFLVARVHREATGRRGRIERVYQLCYGRQPSASEIDAAERFIAAADWQQFARVLFNSNEFVLIP